MRAQSEWHMFPAFFNFLVVSDLVLIFLQNYKMDIKQW